MNHMKQLPLSPKAKWAQRVVTTGWIRDFGMYICFTIGVFLTASFPGKISWILIFSIGIPFLILFQAALTLEIIFYTKLLNKFLDKLVLYTGIGIFLLVIAVLFQKNILLGAISIPIATNLLIPLLMVQHFNVKDSLLFLGAGICRLAGFFIIVSLAVGIYQKIISIPFI